MRDSGVSMAVVKATEHSFVLKLEADYRLPVCWGPSVGFRLSASDLQSGMTRRHFPHALTPASCH